MSVRILIGDCREMLRTLPDESVHCCVTSPPYWGLRDYGVSGQMGLERSPDAYVAEIVAVAREMRRVLRPDGTFWLNLGDSYASAWACKRRSVIGNGSPDETVERGRTGDGLKDKDLVGIPWRVAFALQADGWVLRQEIIWSKPNPMPESVTDRCTKAHEQIFMFAKAKWSGPANGRFASITDEDARWLALCVDTEGCISIKRVKQIDGGADTFAPQVTFGGTHRPLVQKFASIVGHGNIAERPGKNAPMFYWQIANNLARDLLHRIYPFLVVKPRQARIGIYVDDLVYFRGGKMPSRKCRSEAENNVLISLWARNKECNRFGTPDLSDVPDPQYGRWSSCERYYFDAAAIAEPAINSGRIVVYDGSQKNCETDGDPKFATRITSNRTVSETRNKRSVWEIATQSYSEAHFATFPPALIEPCILAGCPEGGTVLDPFGGAGTTGLVCDRLNRNAILIELNPEYAAMARNRIEGECPMFAEVAA